MLSVVIPVKNGGADLARCLDAIDRQTLDEPIEVVVVDSGSTDDSRAIAGRHGAAVYEMPAAKFTHGGSRNLGARNANGDVLVFISQDAYPIDNHWLASLARHLRQDTRVAGVYGRQIPHEGALPPEVYFLDFLYGPEGRIQVVNVESELSMDTTLFSNVNSAVRRSMWEAFPFAENVVMSEDQIWSRSALLAGYRLVYEPAAAVRHSHNYTLKAAFQRFFDSGASAERAYLPDNARSSSVLRRRTASYARGELIWLWRTGQRSWIPYATVYESAKLMGLLLGMNHKRLPQWLNRRLTALPSGWASRSPL